VNPAHDLISATLPDGASAACPNAMGESASRAMVRLHAVTALQGELCPEMGPLAVMRRAAARLRHVLAAEYGAVAVPVGRELEYAAIDGGPVRSPPIRLHVDASLTGWCFSNGRSVRCDEIAADPRASVVARKALHVRSLVAAPLVARGRIIGVLAAMARAPAAFDDEDVATLELLAGIVGSVLAQAAAAQERELLLMERTAAMDQLRFRSHLLDTVEQGVIAVDRMGYVTYWNAHAERLFGYSAGEAQGALISQLIPIGNASASQAGLAALAAGTSWRRELQVHARSGTLLDVSISSTPIVQGGEIIGGVGVLVDLAERNSLEEQLRHAQKMEALGQLAGGVAHDFNNILTSIISYAELLLENAGEDTRDDIMEIRSAGWRAAELTGKLLAFSRKKKANVVLLNLGEEVRALDGMLRRLLREDLDYAVASPAQPVFVRADRTQLEQVLMNLVVNARDAMPAAGRISVSVQESAGADGRYAQLAVRDTGTGMSAETIRRIFEPFFTTKPEGKGTGLGLAVVNGIVRQLNGRIEVISAPGSGTEFRIMIPAECGPAGDGDPKHPSPAPARASSGSPVPGTGSLSA
jgi:PAS domain S-box-containing protein